MTMPSDDRAPPGVVRVRAPNPSALTLDGTNSYIVDAWVVDPGPAREDHIAAIVRAAGERGIAGIVLTHGHIDHDEAAPALAERVGGVPVVRPPGETRSARSARSPPRATPRTTSPWCGAACASRATPC